MANKIIKIPVSSIDGLNENGGYSLRYRIASKDGNRKSEWSDITNINFATDIGFGYVYSFYERLGFGKARLEYYNLAAPLDANNFKDPHSVLIGSPAQEQAYSITSVFRFLPQGDRIDSSISISQDTEGILTYSWDSLERYGTYAQQKFDVYLCFRDDASGWGNWNFAGTTTANSFSFTSPLQGQYVQAAVFLSSFPKLDNIYHNETNFVSISSPFNVYRDSGVASVSSWTVPGTGGKYSATLSGLAEKFPANGWQGRKVYADTTASSKDRGAFVEALVTVKRRISDSSIEIETSNSGATTGNIYNVSLV